jgi:site-specific DNA recombinase
MTDVCARLRQNLDSASFARRRELVELLIDRVVVTDDDVEIRYVVPTTAGSLHTRFCQLRQDYLHDPSVSTKPLARVDAAPGNPRRDSALPQCPPGRPEVVSLVRVQLCRPLPGSSWFADRTPNRLHRIDQWLQ